MADENTFEVLFKTSAELSGADQMSKVFGDLSQGVERIRNVLREYDAANAAAEKSANQLALSLVKEEQAMAKADAEAIAMARSLKLQAESQSDAGHATEGHTQQVLALRMAATGAKEAGWAYAAFLRGDFVTAMHEAKFASIGLGTAISTGGLTAAAVGLLGLAIAAWETMHTEAANTATAAKEIDDKVSSAAQSASDEAGEYANITEQMDAQVKLLEKQRKIRDEATDAQTATEIAGIDEAEAGGLPAEEARRQRVASRLRGDQRKIEDKIATNDEEAQQAVRQTQTEKDDLASTRLRQAATERALARRKEEAEAQGLSPDDDDANRARVKHLEELATASANLSPDGSAGAAGESAQAAATAARNLAIVREAQVSRARETELAERRLMVANDKAAAIIEEKNTENEILLKKEQAMTRSAAAQEQISKNAETKAYEDRRKNDSANNQRDEAGFTGEAQEGREKLRGNMDKMQHDLDEARKRSKEAEDEIARKLRDKRISEYKKEFAEQHDGREPQTIPDRVLDGTEDDPGSNRDGRGYGRRRRGDALRNRARGAANDGEPTDPRQMRQQPEHMEGPGHMQSPGHMDSPGHMQDRSGKGAGKGMEKAAAAAEKAGTAVEQAETKLVTAISGLVAKIDALGTNAAAAASQGRFVG